MNLFDNETEMSKGAVISACQQYRYKLWRTWDKDKPIVLFIGLNPSTADAELDDPTIRRCIGFAKAWGCGGLIMANLFAYRATEPKDMKNAYDAIGPDNDEWLRKCATDANIIVAAWGAHGGHLNRNLSVIHDIKGMRCLGKTKDGHPKHPLYLASSTVLEQFGMG